MSFPEFFQTGMGKKYYESTLPRIATALEKIAKSMEITIANTTCSKCNGNGWLGARLNTGGSARGVEHPEDYTAYIGNSETPSEIIDCPQCKS